MTRNDQTMTAVWERDFDGLPARDELDESHRFLLVCSEGIGKHVEHVAGGCFSSISDAIASYDWCSGVPEYLIDLCSEPDDAIVPLRIEVSPRGERGSLGDYGLEYEDAEV